MLQQHVIGTSRSQNASFFSRPALRSRARVVSCAAIASPFKVQLLHPVKVADADQRPLLVFLPGTDGTGQAVTPQLPGLLEAGYDVRTLYIPPDDRSGWEQLQAQALYLISAALGSRPPGQHNVQVTIVAESFGGCLALRLAAAAPQLLKALVLINPATCYNQSLSGLSAFVSATNLLGVFPQDLYNTAQAVLLPFLVDMERVGRDGAQALRSMIFMNPPPDYETPANLQVTSVDDQEADVSSLTLAAEKRRLQVNTSAVFTTAGQQISRAGLPGGSSPRVGAAGRSTGRVTGIAAAAGLFNTAAGGAGMGRGSVFAPAAAANFRSNLLRSGNLPDDKLREVTVPTLLISSAKDRMLPSIAEGARLARLLPRSRRVILPDSGHAALLERGLDLATIMRGSGIMPASIGPTSPLQRYQPAAAIAGNGTGSSSSSIAAPAGKPALLGIVRDDAAIPGKRDSSIPPRPATLFPSTAAVTSSGSGTANHQQQQQQPSPAVTAAGTSAAEDGAGSVSAGAAATSAAAVAAAIASGGAAAGTAAGGSSSSGPDQVLPGATENGTGRASGSSSQSNSRSGSPVETQQQLDQQTTGAVDKDLAWDQWSQYLAPWRDLVSPVLLGQEHLPALVGCNRPLLFVGNHQKMGLYDMPLFAYELYMRGFKVKGLAHPGHWGGPLGPFFEQFGAVKAGPMTAYKLLKSREQVLLFPGGAREVNKRVGQEYTLFWKESPDFVRLAARCGAIIVPFAAVGADDAYDVMMEAEDLLEAPIIGNLVKSALARVDPSLDPKEAALPLTRVPGLGLPTPVPIPNLQRLYFKICEPVDTQHLGLDVKGDAQGWQELYDGIKATIVSGMEELLEVRAADDQRDVGARISKTFNSWLPAFSIATGTEDTTGNSRVSSVRGSRGDS